MNYCLRWLLISALCVSFALPPSLLRAEESAAFADTKTGKGTKMFLDSMAQFFEDMKELQGKTDAEKVEYILTKGGDRIIAKAAEGFKEQYKTYLTKYAEENIRAKLFQQIAAPKITHDYLMKGLVSGIKWGDIDAEIGYKHPNAMRAVGTGIKALEVTMGAMVKWYQKGPMEGAVELCKGITDGLGEWLIPGWGYFRAAQGLVEALGNYVMGYAFDTALQSKIATICPVDPKSDPKGFAQWLLDLKDIPGFVQREWDEQLAYGGWYAKYDGDDKTKEASGDAMQKAIVATLTKLQAGLRQQKAEFERVQEQIDARQKEYDDKARLANDQINALTKQILDKVQPYLDKIRQFKAQEVVYKKEDAKDYFQSVESLSAGTSRSCAAALDRKTSFDALELAYLSVTDGSFDRQKLLDHHAAYRKIKEAEIKSGWSRNLAATRRFENGCDGFTVFKAYWVDLAAMDAAEQVLYLEAAEQSVKLNEKLQAAMDRYKTSADAAQQEFTQAIGRLYDEAQRTLHFPDAWHNPRFPSFFGAYRMDSALIGSGLVYQRYEELLTMKDQLARDKSTSASLMAKEAAIAAQYAQVLANIRNDFEALVPKNLQQIDGDARSANLSVLGVSLLGPFYCKNTQHYATVQGMDGGAFSSAQDHECSYGHMAGIGVTGSVAVMIDPLEGREPQPDHEQARAELNKIIAETAPMADKDFLAVRAHKLAGRVYEDLKEYLFSDPQTEQQEAERKFLTGNGDAYIAAMKSFWESYQQPIEQAQALQKKLGVPYVIGEIDQLKDLIPRKIAFWESFAGQRADQQAKAAEQGKLVEFKTDLAALVAGRDIRKQYEGLKRLQERIAAETFSFMAPERDALLASLNTKKEELKEKLDMLGAGLGSAGNVPPQDLLPLVQEAIGKIANAYEQKDSRTFGDYVSDNYLGGKSTLVDGARFDFDIFASQSMTLHINRIDTRKDGATVDARWDKQATVRANGQDFKTSGRTTIVFILEGGRMQIKNLRGDLLFASLSPQIAQASGLGQAAVAAVERAHDQRDPGALSVASAAPGIAVDNNAGVDPVPQEPQPPVPVIDGVRTVQGVFPALHASFDLSSGTAGPAGSGDFTMLGGVLRGEGGAQIRQVNMDLDSIAQAPSSGYNDSVILSDGQTYCFKTREGYYGKMRIQRAMGIPFIFEYALQTNGSRDLQ